MDRIASFLLIVAMFLSSGLAVAGGGGGGKAPTYDWKNSDMIRVANDFVRSVATRDYAGAYAQGGEVLRTERSLEAFTADMQNWGFDRPGTVEWEKGNNALPANNGFKIMGTYTARDGESFPVYIHLEGDAHKSNQERNREWSASTKWTVMDYRSGQSMFTRLGKADGSATPLDWFLAVCAGGLLIAFIGLVWSYVRGLRGHPRELWLMFFTKLTEYSAYGSATAVMVLFLQNDVMFNGQPLGDSPGYLYYMVWGLVATIITMMVGAVCDTIGVKKCLLIGAVMLLISRFCMPLSQDIFFVTILGFLPLAFGFAITGPVLKVGIKWFTTLKTATLGFGLFYTLMNVGFWVGAELADYFRKNHADGVEFWGIELTTYQAIIFIGFLINIPDFIAILLMREGAEMTEKGLVIRKHVGDDQATTISKLQGSVGERRAKMTNELVRSLIATAIVGALAYGLVEFRIHEWSVGVIKAGSYVWAFVVTAGLIALGGVLYAALSHAGAASPGASFDRVMKSVRDATEGTVEQLKENFQQRPFWVYMAMLGILVFVRLTFYVFHVMFPTYAIRVFGDDFPVSSIFGSLNPAMIIFLVPLISALTVNVRSYTMLIVGTGVSAASVFLCFMPESMALAIGDSWLGTWIFDYWLEAPVGNQDPFLVSLVVFIIVFTIGEALWSPRLMQFSAEIAPRGKEGAYISLAVLPYFVGKIGATVMADMLTAQYFSQDMVEFPDHQLSWAWIGGMALISPIGMVIWRKTFNQSEKMAEDEAKAQVAAEEAEAAAVSDDSSGS
jgi:MFS family permease